MAVKKQGLNKTSDNKDDENEEFRYGWFGYTPDWLQRFNTAGWFLFWMFWWNNFGSMVNNGLLGVVLSSIETRFGLTSTQSSWIVTSYDVAGIPLVLLISVYGNNTHRPRWTAIGTLLVFIGTIVVVLPHFTTGAYNPILSETDNYLCGNRTGVNPFCENQSGGDLSLYLILFIAGRVIAGLGSPPSYTLGLTHMDDITPREKFGLYTGIFACGGLLGPAIGYLAGGYLLELHTDFYQVDTDSVDFDMSDPRWVGCWWLGFLVGAVLVFINIFPFAAFPRDLPGAAEMREKKVSEVHNKAPTSAPSGGENHDDKNAKKETLKYLKVLLTNPTYFGVMVYAAIDGLIVAGFTAFGPKFMETQFNMDASTAGMIFGVVTVPGAGGGAIFGGWLIDRFSLSCKAILKAQVVLNVLVCLTALGFLIWCDSIPVAGVNVAYNGSADISLEAACITDCYCGGVPFSPVCSHDGMQYLSPCHAGCSNYTTLSDNSREYLNCTCISDAVGQVAEASTGTCEGPDCPLEPLFLTIFFLAMFFMFAAGTMVLPVMFRCVPGDAKNMGVSLSNVVGRLLGWLPGPIIFGAVFDSACLLWSEDCGERGACLFYDNEQVGLNVFILVSGFKILSLIAIGLAFFLYKPPKTAYEDLKSNSSKDSRGSSTNEGKVTYSKENEGQGQQRSNMEKDSDVTFVVDNKFRMEDNKGKEEGTNVFNGNVILSTEF